MIDSILRVCQVAKAQTFRQSGQLIPSHRNCLPSRKCSRIRDVQGSSKPRKTSRLQPAQCLPLSRAMAAVLICRPFKAATIDLSPSSRGRQSPLTQAFRSCTDTRNSSRMQLTQAVFLAHCASQPRLQATTYNCPRSHRSRSHRCKEHASPPPCARTG